MEWNLKDPKVFEKLVDRFEAAFLRKANSIIGNEEDARDVVQEAFVKIYLNAGKFEERADATLSSWAYKILINTCLSHYKKHKRERGNVVFDENLLKEAGEVSEESYTERFLRVTSKLPVAARGLLKSLAIEGKTPQEIAEKEGVSYETMRVRIHRAKRIFKKVLTHSNL
ncbi:MAG TPA: RNA polymerase sigma factor [Candidatus Paceibacterota bacterium]